MEGAGIGLILINYLYFIDKIIVFQIETKNLRLLGGSSISSLGLAWRGYCPLGLICKKLFLTKNPHADTH